MANPVYKWAAQTVARVIVSAESLRRLVWVHPGTVRLWSNGFSSPFRWVNCTWAPRVDCAPPCRRTSSPQPRGPITWCCRRGTRSVSSWGTTASPNYALKKKAHFISLFAFTLVFLLFYLFFFFEMLTELHKPKLSSPTQPRRTCSTLRIRPVDVPRGLSRCGQLPQPNYILFRLGHWRPHRLVANLAALMHPDHRLFISLTHSVTQTQAHTHPGIHQQHRVDNFGRDAIQFVAVWVIFLPFHFVKLIKKFGFWI